jgi:hypothetical protein
MDDGGYIGVLLENGKRIVVVTKIDLVILDLFPGDFFDPGKQ